MHITLGELAQLVDGKLIGDAAIEITGANPLADATAGEITLIDISSKLSSLEKSFAAAAIVPDDTQKSDRQAACIPTIAVADTRIAFETIMRKFRTNRPPQMREQHPTAHINPNAQIADDVHIGPFVVIADDVQIESGCTIHAHSTIARGCRLGKNVTLHPNVTLYEDTQLGEEVELHSGVVLGANGFGYRVENGRHTPCSQWGNVKLGARVEIGANSTIDRGVYGATFVDEGTKIDNLVQIGHNCRIGKHNILCSQVGIAGSTTTGDYVVMAGQVGVKDHVHIGDQAILSAMAGIIGDVPAGAVMMGVPATPQREQKLKLVALAKLPQMRKDFKTIQKAIANITAKSENAVCES